MGPFKVSLLRDMDIGYFCMVFHPSDWAHLLGHVVQAYLMHFEV